MAKCWLFIVCAVAVVGANADDLADFSNNLATDIGPLLVLFGESMTRQYLSESTSFLDYFIFAMAPIGILTAVISTIRVCGHSSLRAFIGRSQEGDGVVEAELCTSTSRDVCELFNKGGITRVLGRPNILELVYVPRCSPEVQNPSPGTDEARLYLFRNYLEEYAGANSGSPGPVPQANMVNDESNAAGWTIVRGSIPRSRNTQDDTQDDTPPPFAPKPNLSLNVGIKKQPDWVFSTVAVVGFVLQAGVLALAGVGVWILRWNINNAETPASRYYAPVMFITGTVLMCGGMWSCAALIGQTTHELRYKREPEFADRSRLIWLQPGSQVIGDQTFDPFAYFDKKDDPLLCWTSSKKNFDERFEAYTIAAVSAVLVGYIMQFIGLRGMTAWVSLAQLGITVVMSILRGLLRMQRLGRDDNMLAKMPDLVEGHELDWLAFQIALQEPQKGSFWHITGQHEQATEAETPSNGSPNVSQSHELSSRTGMEALGGKPISGPTNNPQSPATSGKDQVNSEDLLRIRARLSCLTGHSSFSNIEDPECQKWKDDYVKVRTNARKLSATICQASERLPWKRLYVGDIMLQITSAMSLHLDSGVTRHQQPISVTLKPPSPGSTKASWSIDSAQLEAILGLWMWSLLSDELVADKKDPRNIKSRAESVEAVRIVSAGTDDERWDEKTNIQGEMSLWLGPNAVTSSEAILTIDNHDNYGIVDLWKLRDSGKRDSGRDWERVRIPGKKQSDQSKSGRLSRRFCGWNLVHKSLGSGASGSTRAATAPSQPPDQQVKVQFFPINHSLLDICTQELFVALTSSLAGLLTIGKATVVESAGNVQLDNPAVTVLAKAFVENGMGSHFDALSCIIPALGNQLRPDPEVMLSALIKGAETYRQAAEWERAETLLQWACRRYSQPLGGDRESTPMPTSKSLIGSALRATGELYRWSLAQHSDDERKRFGRSGVEWMIESYRSAGQSDSGASEILYCYEAVAERMKDSPQDIGGIQENTRNQQQLVQAIRDGIRADALYHLCFVTTGDFGSEYLQPALPLAVRNDWSEVVGAILEMKANPNSRDEDGRTAISYCAKLGYELYVKLLIDHGASLDLSEKGSWTPLFWTAKNGHANIAKLLLNTGNVDANRPDVKGRTPLWLAADNGHEAVVGLLVEKGADKEARHKDYGWTPLWWAADKGHEAVVQLLLEKGADKEARHKDYGWTPLWRAADKGHEAVVQLLLEKGADTEAQDKDGWTPLGWAADKGHEAVVRLLLEKGADTEAKGKYGWTPLWWAAEKGHEAVVRLLLEKGADTEAQGIDGWTPLGWAARNGHEAVVRLLLEKGADTEAQGEDGWTPLSWAADKGHEAVMRLLLEKGADTETQGEYGRTPLSWAAGNGHHEAVVRLLLETGAELESKDKDGRTPLSWAAAEYGHEAVVRLLLEKGAELESKDKDGRTPLSWAAENGHHEAVVRLLLETGAELESKDKDGRTPLWVAAEYGHEAVVRLLLEKGADTEAQGEYGRTPLSWAAGNGRHEAVVRLLLEKGADTEAQGEYGRTPLSWAARNGHEAVVRLLLEKGAELESKDKDGRTPLSWAAENGHHEAVVRLLLEKGAELESKDEEYNNIQLSMAAEYGHEAVVRLLLEKGADTEAQGEYGRTPLSWAAGNGHEAVVRLLLEKGAELESKDKDGRTPLSWAGWFGHMAVVRLLLEKGADPEAKGIDGQTPLRITP